MNEPSNIVANLRLMARLVRDYDYAEISRMLREAADTITSLWNSLTVSEAALNKAAGNWAKADAELGSGTCRDVSANPLRFECSECGGLSIEIAPRFCPCCGREVVDEC